MQFWRTSSDLTKFQTTQSFVQLLCDSWASCTDLTKKTKQYRKKLKHSWTLWSCCRICQKTGQDCLSLSAAQHYIVLQMSSLWCRTQQSSLHSLQTMDRPQKPVIYFGLCFYAVEHSCFCIFTAATVNLWSFPLPSRLGGLDLVHSTAVRKSLTATILLTWCIEQQLYSIKCKNKQALQLRC